MQRNRRQEESNYELFLASKRSRALPIGITADYLNPHLFDFQQLVVKKALKIGRFAIFADTGMGKSLMEMEWAHHIACHTQKPILLFTPLAVAQQFIKEGDRFGYSVNYCQSQADVVKGINITNYEKLHKFDAAAFGGIVIDESSCLKGYDSVYRKALTEFASTIDFRLCATATPAPNDLVEITNHAEFLGVLSGKEVIALYFTQDGNTTHAWRLKGHAKQPFYRWLASWSCAFRKPSDLGNFDDTHHILPAIAYHHHQVEPDRRNLTTLFPMEASTLAERRQAKRDSLPQRIEKTAEIINNSPETWVIWCELNLESQALIRAIPDAVELTGSQPDSVKESILNAFVAGEIRVLVSKPVLCGFGLNWQHCHHIAFVGLSDSFEQQYQAIRRCWRFGQKNPVDVHYITSVQEGAIVANVKRKEAQYTEMMDNLIKEMHDFQIENAYNYSEVKEDLAEGQDWKLYLGDCCDRVREIESESIGLSIFSPPFPLMYVYSDLDEDMGNVQSINNMIEHFSFLIPEIKRVLMPGRLCCVHLCQITAMKHRDGYIGLKDYRGKVIELFDAISFPYAGEVTIEKNPQIQATRNKERGLLFKSLATDSAMMRMALADYLLYFRKPGDNPEPIKAGISQKYNLNGGWITEQEWIEWASPVWYRQRAGFPGGIRETDVLNVRTARESDDERHLAPLQLGVIERAVKLWSNPGDRVFSPFAGIGSEGYQSLLLNRKFVGIELKESYWKTAIANLKRAEQNKSQQLKLAI